MPQVNGNGSSQVVIPQGVGAPGAREASAEAKHEPESQAVTLTPPTTRAFGALALHLTVLPDEVDRPASRPTPRLQRMAHVISGTILAIRATLSRQRAQVVPAAQTFALESMPPVVIRYIARFLRSQDESALGAASQRQRNLLEPVLDSRRQLLRAVESLNIKYDRLYLRHAALRVEHEILDAGSRGVDPYNLGHLHSQRAYRMELLERRMPDDPQKSDLKLKAIGKELSNLEENMRMNCRAIAIVREDWIRLNVEAQMPRASQPRDAFEPARHSTHSEPREQ